MNPEISQNIALTYTNDEFNHIIFGVLKRLHIDFYHPERADLEQEARIIMAESMVKFDHDHQSACDERERNLYLYQSLYWRLLDRLRRTQRNHERVDLSLDQEFGDEEKYQMQKIMQDFSAEAAFDRLEMNHFFTKLLSSLSTQQRRYVQFVYLGYTNTEIAKRMHISKQAVTNLRRRVIECGRKLL